MARKTKKKPVHKHIVHHTKRIYLLTPRFIHGMVIGSFAGLVLVLSLGPFLPASALTVVAPRDCNSNSVINCGAQTVVELQQGYERRGVKTIYAHFGIGPGDIADIGQYASAGRVYKNGNVMIDDTLVATDAVTAGRENINGSTRVVSGDTVFFTRQPHVSFRPDSIPAFVVMKNGQFQFAIIASCGNPVNATKIPPKEEPPKPEPPKEEPPPVAVKTSTQTPDSTPTPVVIAKAELPETGPADIGIVVGLAIIGGYIYHITHRHIRRKRQVQF